MVSYMVMLVTVLTLPAGASGWNQAVCGSLRQFRAVDAQWRSSANSFTVNSFFMTVLSLILISTALTIPVCDDAGKYPTSACLGQLETVEDNGQAAGLRECS